MRSLRGSRPAGAPDGASPADLETQVRKLLAAGDDGAAATRVIEALGPPVLGYLCKVHGTDDGKDVFSSWEVAVWKSLPAFRFEASLRVWSYRLAWNAAARFHGDPWRRRRERLATSAASRLPDASSSRQVGGRRGDLEELSDELDPEETTLLMLRLQREMTWEEISAVLSEEGRPLKPPALRKRYQRIKDRMARRARGKGLLR
jgi:RNA polymerase sigma-70 factor (ECF subfamily)